MSSVDLGGLLEDLKRSDEEVRKDTDKKLETKVKMIITYVRRYTPVESGNLKQRWRRRKFKRKYDTYYVISNIAEYAKPVEVGHKTRQGKGKYKGTYVLKKSGKTVNKKWKPKSNGQKKTKGFHMLQKAIKMSYVRLGY